MSDATSSAKGEYEVSLYKWKPHYPVASFDLIGGDYHTKQYLASEKGHKYVKQLNPALISVKPFLDDIKEPSVLLLRGCDMLLQSPDFSFDKFKSITTLEISGCRHLNTLQENTISQMTNLQSLDLSHLQIDQLPADLFENAADSLRSLVISGCSNLNVLPVSRRPLLKLEYLDLSHLPIESLPNGLIASRLRSIILKGCFKLRSLLLEGVVERVDFLDLCRCTSLGTLTLPPGDDDNGSRRMLLDISYTALGWINVPQYVCYLFFRNANLRLSECTGVIMRGIWLCDLSGSQDLQGISMLQYCSILRALDLSRTAIESLRFLSELTYLHTLILRGCSKLKHLPTIEKLKFLQVLDLSGCEILDDLPEGLSKQRRLKELNLCGCKALRELREDLFYQMFSLEKLDISNTCFRNLPSFARLINHGVVIKQSHESVLEDTRQTELFSPIDLDSDNIGIRSEFHLVSTFMTNSAFDRFRYGFEELNDRFSSFEELLTNSAVDTEINVKRQFESVRAGLKYILGKVDLLESSHNCSSQKILVEILNYGYNYDDDQH